MNIIRSEALELHTSGDVVLARQRVRAWMLDLGFGLIDQTKMVTAASELARNTVEYGGGGDRPVAGLGGGAPARLRRGGVEPGEGAAPHPRGLHERHRNRPERSR